VVEGTSGECAWLGEFISRQDAKTKRAGQRYSTFGLTPGASIAVMGQKERNDAEAERTAAYASGGESFNVIRDCDGFHPGQAVFLEDGLDILEDAFQFGLRILCGVQDRIQLLDKPRATRG
jgi:hypothetical protein